MSTKGLEILSIFVHRLAAVFAEMDRELYGEGTKEAMPDQEKVYRCRECEETFPSSQALAGHVNHHRHVARAAQQEKALQQAKPEGKGDLRDAASRKAPHRVTGKRAAPPENGGGLPCPTCAQPLPAMVRVVAEDFTLEGVDEALAAKLAAKACGLLRVPA